MSTFHRKPNTFVKRVDLRVADFNRSLAFYQNVIGFQVLQQSERKAVLTADGQTGILTIEQPDDVIPKQNRTTGLYHFALLLPDRHELGKVFKHLLDIGYPLQGGSDHLVSEALYLADPDGNGIEIYADRPSESWHWSDGEVSMSTEPLNVESLLAEGKGEYWGKLPKNTIMGHIHLHVSDLRKSEEFYCAGLGFDIVCRYGNSALFISTGKYHHHIGLNTWNGVGAPKPPENSVGLIQFSLAFPDENVRESAVGRLKQLGYQVSEKNDHFYTIDPSGNQIQLVVES